MHIKMPNAVYLNKMKIISFYVLLLFSVYILDNVLICDVTFLAAKSKIKCTMDK